MPASAPQATSQPVVKLRFGGLRGRIVTLLIGGLTVLLVVISLLAARALREALSKEFISFSATGAFYLVPNPNMKPFDPRGVRRAIEHAIDRDAIVKNVLQGVGKPAFTFDPPDLPQYVDPAKFPEIVPLVPVLPLPHVTAPRCPFQNELWTRKLPLLRGVTSPS